MSLISTTNFLAPLRSKMQVGTILVLGVLVGVLRFVSSHGPIVERVRGYDGPPTASRSAARQDPGTVDSEIEAYLASRKRGRVPEASGDSEVDGLLRGDGGDDSHQSSNRPRSAEGGQPEKLNDIKKSLGL